MVTHSDRIEKKIVLRAPLERVWRAVTEAKQFGTWFGLACERDFAPGERVTGTMVSTQVDDEIAKLQEPHIGLRFELDIERIEPMTLFSYRWHPFAIDRDADYSGEPKTLVEFRFEAVDGGTELTIVESGFDALPLARRTDAFEANDEGWGTVANLLVKYVTR
jgi:uncharacterized protein YndB with AHSA1/START domain